MTEPLVKPTTLPQWLTDPSHRVTLEDGSELAQFFAGRKPSLAARLDSITWVTIAFLLYMLFYVYSSFYGLGSTALEAIVAWSFLILIYVQRKIEKRRRVNVFATSRLPADLGFLHRVGERMRFKLLEDLYLAGYSGKDILLGEILRKRIWWANYFFIFLIVVMILPIVALSDQVYPVLYMSIHLWWIFVLMIGFKQAIFLHVIIFSLNVERLYFHRIPQENYWRCLFPSPKSSLLKRSIRRIQGLKGLGILLGFLVVIATINMSTIAFGTVTILIFMCTPLLIYQGLTFKRRMRETIVMMEEECERMDALHEAYIQYLLHDGEAP